jgi:hypothetical protein
VSRAVSLAIALLATTGCYRSHRLTERSATDGGPVELVPDAGRTFVGDDGELARCFTTRVATAIAVGPERECVTRMIAAREGGGCQSFEANHLGTALRVVRRAVGRVDLRLACPGSSCAVYAISPDACDGCNEVPFDSSFASPRFAASQVDGLLELVIEGGTANVDVCFDPDYGPPPWDE